MRTLRLKGQNTQVGRTVHCASSELTSVRLRQRTKSRRRSSGLRPSPVTTFDPETPRGRDPPAGRSLRKCIEDKRPEGGGGGRGAGLKGTRVRGGGGAR